MTQLLVVCTGNVCRSPLTATLLEARLGDLVAVTSAGTRALVGSPMTGQTASLALERGVPPERIAAHRARDLRAEDVREADLVVALAREHRRAVVRTHARALRRTFTLRELARLARATTPDNVRAAAIGGADPAERLHAALHHLAQVRDRAGSADADDVVDPYGGPDGLYALAGGEIDGAVPDVVRLIRAALLPVR